VIGVTTEVFVDTWGWIEGHWQAAKRHAEASALLQRLRLEGARWVTTNCVMLELCGSKGQRPGLRRDTLVALYQQIYQDPLVEVVHIDRDAQREAFETYFRSYRDKGFPLVDCTSFLVMKRRGIVRVVTDDNHFRQVGLGFQVLPDYA
jgi:predicted nucleic acid-binding protein